MLDIGPSLDIISKTDAIREETAAWRAQGLRVALVPTMGALHDGHLRLIHAAREPAYGGADRVVASLFVNPTQFTPHEDFERYPRDLQGDIAKLADAGCHVLFTPERRAMYPLEAEDGGAPAGFRLHPPPYLAEPLEGAVRPGFFTGVATVVAKLLALIAPDVALFGEKDYQQLLIIRSMVRDMMLPVRIVGVPTVRDENGLALASRNAYLSEAAMEKAPMFHAYLRAIEHVMKAENAPFTGARDDATAQLLALGFESVEYIALCDADTLEPLDALPGDRTARLFGAVRIDGTRLIDNIAIQP